MLGRSRSSPTTSPAPATPARCSPAAAPFPSPCRPRRAVEAAVRVVDTESRAVAPAEAAERVSAVAGRAPVRLLVQEDRLHAARTDRRRGRRADARDRGGHRHRVSGLSRPAACRARSRPAGRRRAGGRDPDRAATRSSRARASSVVDLLRPQLDRALAWIPIDQLRAGGEALAARVRRLAGTAIIADAETDADLDALVDAALAVTPAPLLVGSAGLARALAARLGLLGERVELPAGARWLDRGRQPAPGDAPADPRRARGRAQRARHGGAPRRRAARTPSPGWSSRRWRRSQREAWDLLVVTGGETAVALWTALGAERLDLLGVPAPGLAFGHLRVPGRDPTARAHQGRRLRAARPVRVVAKGGRGMKRPVLGVTMGDPAGVGPEIIVRAAAEPAVRAACRPVVIGAAAHDARGARPGRLGVQALHAVSRVADCRWAERHRGGARSRQRRHGRRCRAAEVSAAAGRAAYEYIERAVTAGPGRRDRRHRHRARQQGGAGRRPASSTPATPRSSPSSATRATTPCC